MSVVPDILRLAIPSGRVPNGIFSVSEDGDFLIGFKDAIGIYSPRFRIEPFDQSVYNRMDFFLPSSRLRNAMLRPDIDQIKSSDQPELKDFCRHALSVCNRTIVSAESKPRDTKAYVRYSFRAASWSPSGLDQFGRCIFSCITENHQLLLCGKSADSWQNVSQPSAIGPGHPCLF
uniref:Transcription factor IIIC subunit delta N-term n=1 Tax=Schistocephalus solidus TaxID=70667 RepID=A0A0X3P0T9_SCHSO